MIFTDIQASSHKIKLPIIIENKDTDGVIFFQDTQSQILKEIESRGIPCVVIDAHPGNELYSMVIANYENAAATATKHLISMNHKKIAFICSSFLPNFYTQVFNGFRKVMSQNRLLIYSNWIQMDAIDEITACQCMDNILQSGDIPTAVFCATDIFAIGAMKCAKSKGYKVPEDISFIGIDDILLAQYVEPALTTIRIDKAKMGDIAMDMIIQRINGKEPESVVLESDKLIIRDSVMDRGII
jgi:DNA-binding LacI/PurR family transcriptional regulator